MEAKMGEESAQRNLREGYGNLCGAAMTLNASIGVEGDLKGCAQPKIRVGVLFYSDSRAQVSLK
ncbi:hypothetical protein Syun_017860 [Stephania yunnanensis]|uniref:Uncharacterized protein n=1 Tax=Stephania yunnanensis TaxID=152371 RepID=A0AAP0JA08_9MAGN